ncbi:hypothetical protein ACVIHD_001122 [Bradyrhizobium embrapense]
MMLFMALLCFLNECPGLAFIALCLWALSD